MLDQRGGFNFTKEIMADEHSEVHYKFRLGPGDWWALDPDADTDDDGELHLFSHECLSASGDDRTVDSQSDKLSWSQHHVSSQDSDEEGFGVDFDDPRLEHFPSDRDSILATMRRLPLSPAPAEEPTAGTEDRPGLSPSATGTATSRLSLHSIAEGDEFHYDGLAERFEAAAHHSGPAHKYTPSHGSTGSDLDEGIAMIKAFKPEPAGGTSPRERLGSLASEEPISPKTVPVRMMSRGQGGGGGGQATSTAAEISGEVDIRNRASVFRPTSPSSTHSDHDVDQGGHWIRAFFRVVLVDWIGGIIRWIWARSGRA
ncbi:hypothetical protein GGR56DRAFT_671934 [Xylariaceae sp. FL0804]|nr:hypothetical protein GGR56DRAFT_671934 [Xylariaceae sp. FL0804]